MITISQEIAIIVSQIVEDQDIDSFKNLNKEHTISKRLLGLLLTESIMKRPYNCQYLISPLIMHLSNYLYFSSEDNKNKLLQFLRIAQDKKEFENITDATSMHCETWKMFPCRLKNYIKSFYETIPSIEKINECERLLLKKLISDTFRAHDAMIDELLEDAYQEKHKDDYDIQLYQKEREYDRTSRL